MNNERAASPGSPPFNHKRGEAVMKITIALMFFCLAFAMRREAAGQPQKPSDDDPVVQADNQFALDLYGRLNQEQPNKNLFFSPTSISLALTMTAGGARGQTLAEMVKAFHLGEDWAKAHAHYHKLLDRWNAVGQQRAYQLRVANRLWGQKAYVIRPEFLALTRQEYGAEMTLLDFAQSDPARREINLWVEQQTNDKIKDLIPPGAITAQTRLVLTNAVYFKGDWTKQFDKKDTKNEDFTVSAQQKIKTPLMQQKATLGYAEEDTFQALEMPYAGGDLAMVVLLPKTVDGLPDLERLLSVDRLAAVLAKLRPQEVISLLPKFKLDTSFNLNATLQSLGIESAFSDKADFSGISSQKDLYLSAVVHKAFVDVNEQGTEAAAATGVVMNMMSARIPAPTPVFRADHPFLFLIRDTTTGSILFLGRLANPSN
jgi:serpin B